MDGLESLIDEQIRRAMERGAFDNLPGAGKPIADLDQQLEPGWWAARVARRERSRARAAEARDALADDERRLWSEPTDAAARTTLASMNERIRIVNLNLEPDDRLPSYDVRLALERWRRLRQQRTRAARRQQ